MQADKLRVLARGHMYGSSIRENTLFLRMAKDRPAIIMSVGYSNTIKKYFRINPVK